MQANLARKNRRVPVLSILFLLLSTIASAIGTISYSVIPAIQKFIEGDHGDRSPFISLIETVAAALAHNAVAIAMIFFLLLILVLLFKPKGWAVSIIATFAAAFMAFVGVILAIKSVGYIVALVSGGVQGGAIITEMIIDTIIYLLPVSISFSWMALGCAGISSLILHKTAKKAIRFSFGALTVALGITGGGMFAISALGNVLAAIKELILVFIFGYDNALTACMLAPVFIFANTLGLIGIILLTVYLIKPYKKKFHPHETDPEIIYAIDEDDPVFHEIDGITDEECFNESEEATEPTQKEKVDEAPVIKKENPIVSFFKGIKEKFKGRSKVFYAAIAVLFAALFLEFGIFIAPGIGIASIFVMLYSKNRITVIVFGILNIVLGGGIISQAAGVLMLFIPEWSITPKEPEQQAIAQSEEATEESNEEISEEISENA